MRSRTAARRSPRSCLASRTTRSSGSPSPGLSSCSSSPRSRRCDPGASRLRERTGVLIVAGGIVSVVAVYVALNATATRDSARDLLPFQALTAQLPDADQRMFHMLRDGLLKAEEDRVRAAAWPEPAALAARGVAPFTSGAGAAAYQWTRVQQGAIVNYFGQPADPAAPAWLLEVQEPEPGMPPDTAPIDEEHHQLSDGTKVHTYVWMHRYGGQVPVGFVRQPQSSGWLQVCTTAPNPALYNRR